jgi:hypothetical protein
LSRPDRGRVATFGDHHGTATWASPSRTLTSTAGPGGPRASGRLPRHRPNGGLPGSWDGMRPASVMTSPPSTRRVVLPQLHRFGELPSGSGGQRALQRGWVSRLTQGQLVLPIHPNPCHGVPVEAPLGPSPIAATAPAWPTSTSSAPSGLSANPERAPEPRGSGPASSPKPGWGAASPSGPQASSRPGLGWVKASGAIFGPKRQRTSSRLQPIVVTHSRSQPAPPGPCAPPAFPIRAHRHRQRCLLEHFRVYTGSSCSPLSPRWTKRAIKSNERPSLQTS